MKEKYERIKENTAEEKFGIKNNSEGITLVALVVTIIVLIILATISINAVLGENGIIKKAQQAKEVYKNTIITDELELNQLLAEYENALAEEIVVEPSGEVIVNDSTYYETLQEALIQVQDNDVIKFIKDVAYEEDFDIDKNLVIDTNGNNITVSKITLSSEKLTINGEGTINLITSTGSGIINNRGVRIK